MDLVLVLSRIIVIFPLFLLFSLYMGKRSIGELPIFDFLVIVTLTNVVGADIADPSVSHIYTVFSIAAIALLQKLVSKLIISNRKIGKVLTFEPTIVIQNGQLLQENMKRIQYSIDNILQMVREKNVFDISEIDLAIVEANGKLSVMKKKQKTNVTIEDVGLVKKTSGISYPIILEGIIYDDVLYDFQLNRKWLVSELQKSGVSDINNVFFASLSREKKLHISLKTQPQPTPKLKN